MNKKRHKQSALQRIQELQQANTQRSTQQLREDNKRRLQKLQQALSDWRSLSEEARTEKRRRLREEEVSSSNIEALRDVQDQFDSLVEQMMDAKLLLAGLAIGFDEMSVENHPSSEWEEEEVE
jgi:hypothetical protein